MNSEKEIEKFRNSEEYREYMNVCNPTELNRLKAEKKDCANDLKKHRAQVKELEIKIRGLDNQISKYER